MYIQNNYISNYLQQLFLALLKPRADFLAEELKDAFADEDYSTMILILTSLSPCAIKEIGSAFSKKYNQGLADAAKKASNGHFESFLVELINGKRAADGPVNNEQAKEDAKALIDAGPEAWIKDKGVFIDIFTHRSFAHIRQVQFLE